jgi:hypothetical protein
MFDIILTIKCLALSCSINRSDSGQNFWIYILFLWMNELLSSYSLALWFWCTTLCNKVCQWFAAGQWFSLGAPVSSTNKPDRHNITEILLKVVLNTITLTPLYWLENWASLVKFHKLFYVQGAEMRSDCSLCWFLWNCWPALFILSFHN